MAVTLEQRITYLEKVCVLLLSILMQEDEMTPELKAQLKGIRHEFRTRFGHR